MEEQQVGWIAAIIIGAIAGWLAEQFMKSQMGLVMNIVLGIIGAASLHPNRDRPRVQRRSSAANMKSVRRERWDEPCSTVAISNPYSSPPSSPR
jgi:F0F1-type ATP synthase assembly protein I